MTHEADDSPLHNHQDDRAYQEALRAHPQHGVHLDLVLQRRTAYQDTRTALMAMRRFGRALEQAIGFDSCLAAFPDFDRWFARGGIPGNIDRLLERTCDSCGRWLLQTDLLGREAYRIEPYEHACIDCASLLISPETSPSLRLARLRAFADQQPRRMGAVIIRAMQLRGWEIEDVEQALDIDEVRFLQLLIYPQIEEDDWMLGISAIAAALPCRVEPLRALVEEGRGASPSGPAGH